MIFIAKISFSFFKINFNWRKIALQWCVGFCHTTAQISHSYANVTLPHSSVGKESTCSAGDLYLIPGSRRFPGKRNGNPLQDSCLESPMDRGACQYRPWGCKSRAGSVTEPAPPPSWASLSSPAPTPVGHHRVSSWAPCVV